MINDGGPAFPTDGRIQHGTAYDGMTKREWFAGMALAGLLANHTTTEGPATIAVASYGMADAMIAAGKEVHRERP